MPIAKELGFASLWITCDPENAASKRTLELVGAEFIETVDVPSDCIIFQGGHLRICQYRLDLNEFLSAIDVKVFVGRRSPTRSATRNPAKRETRRDFCGHTALICARRDDLVAYRASGRWYIGITLPGRRSG